MEIAAQDSLKIGRTLAVDVSSASIEAFQSRKELQNPGMELMQKNILDLMQYPEYKGAFDLIVSYSVLHIVQGKTELKLDLIRYLAKPGAVIAVDALPNILWNRFLFAVIRLLFKMRIAEFAIQILGPAVAPNCPKNYIRDLSKASCMMNFSTENFLDLSCFKNADFLRDFEVLKFELVPQDGPLTGRKARFALRRK